MFGACVCVVFRLRFFSNDSQKHLVITVMIMIMICLVKRVTTGRALENKACWRQRTIFITRGRERMRESSTERERERQYHTAVVIKIGAVRVH